MTMDDKQRRNDGISRIKVTRNRYAFMFIVLVLQLWKLYQILYQESTNLPLFRFSCKAMHTKSLSYRVRTVFNDASRRLHFWRHLLLPVYLLHCSATQSSKRKLKTLARTSNNAYKIHMMQDQRSFLLFLWVPYLSLPLDCGPEQGCLAVPDWFFNKIADTPNWSLFQRKITGIMLLHV